MWLQCNFPRAGLKRWRSNFSAVDCCESAQNGAVLNGGGLDGAVLSAAMGLLHVKRCEIFCRQYPET